MKICVNTISKNEIKFVDKFMESCDGADEVIVADTGSTDGTIEKLRSLGATVHNINVDWINWPKKPTKEWRSRLKKPWRFDVARNMALDMVPEDFDVVISLDLDEVLLKGWRKHLEDAWSKDTTRIRYKYIWNHNPDGSPDVVFWTDKIFSRNNYEWRHPVHEVIYYNGGGREKISDSKIVIEHFADTSKPRNSYLPLLELSTFEDPKNDRNSHYLGREYYFYGKHKKAKEELERHLSLRSSTWKSERARSMTMIGHCCIALGDKDEATKWYLRSCAECPYEREPWVDLAQHYHNIGDHLGGYYAAVNALKIDDRPMTYVSRGYAWGAQPYDIAGTCAFYIGLLEESFKHTKTAYEKDPSNERIKKNLELIGSRLNA